MRIQRVGPDLVFSRLLESLHLGPIIKRALKVHRYEFDVVRAISLLLQPGLVNNPAWM